jgi:NAD(P)-dependent dehydrogenase (short-subunit alcohol dehydrogenase family)
VAADIAELGKVDILIANAGIWTLGSFWELTDEQWDEMIGVNLTGVWKAAKAVAPHMIERRSGSIVIAASVNALEAGQFTAHYVAAKHGLIGLMRTAVVEEVRAEPARLDRRDLDAERRQFVPQALAEALDRELRRAVDPPAGAPDEPAGR